MLFQYGFEVNKIREFFFMKGTCIYTARQKPRSAFSLCREGANMSYTE
jgi:hypothetical protein